MKKTVSIPRWRIIFTVLLGVGVEMNAGSSGGPTTIYGFEGMELTRFEGTLITVRVIFFWIKSWTVSYKVAEQNFATDCVYQTYK